MSVQHPHLMTEGCGRQHVVATPLANLATLSDRLFDQSRRSGHTRVACTDFFVSCEKRMKGVHGWLTKHEAKLVHVACMYIAYIYAAYIIIHTCARTILNLSSCFLFTPYHTWSAWDTSCLSWLMSSWPCLNFYRCSKANTLLGSAIGKRVTVLHKFQGRC